MKQEDLTQASVGPLLGYFDRIIPLDSWEKQLVAEGFLPRLFRKRQYVLQDGDVCKFFTFVVSGCLGMYAIDEKGTTHILQFAPENWWITDMGSFYEKKPSRLNIDALENTTVLQINFEKLTCIYEKSPRLSRIFRVLIENSYIALQSRLLQNISSTAEERYLSFLESYPQLANRLPQTQIAAFLGITPEFVSRIRNNMARRL